MQMSLRENITHLFHSFQKRGVDEDTQHKVKWLWWVGRKSAPKRGRWWGKVGWRVVGVVNSSGGLTVCFRIVCFSGYGHQPLIMRDQFWGSMSFWQCWALELGKAMCVVGSIPGVAVWLSTEITLCCVQGIAGKNNEHIYKLLFSCVSIKSK